MEVETVRFGQDATEHHRHPALRAGTTLDFIGFEIRREHMPI
jgi:hypothetical protein